MKNDRCRPYCRGGFRENPPPQSVSSMWELFVNRSLSVSSLCSSSLCNGASKHHRSNGPSQDRRMGRNFGSTTNQVRGWENSVFSFQFSVFSFQFSVFSFQFSGCSFQGAVFRVQFSGCSFQFSGCRILKSLPIRAIRFIRGPQSSHFLTRV